MRGQGVVFIKARRAEKAKAFLKGKVHGEIGEGPLKGGTGRRFSRR
jgi:hypothetical protein